MFTSVLIANRGEIACRTIRTLRALGIRSIAVHSDADHEALHVAMADEALRIGEAPASSSYLAGERIIAAAKRSGAEAIHPGYGFLSESAGFARACADAGIVFIGPAPDVIELMGEKDRAKAAMVAAGIPVVPGFSAAVSDPAELRAAALELGFPVLIKAAAGGGGRGMRVVHAADQFDDCLESARREARAAFGDDRVLLEHYLERPRHIEVQLFGDAYGQVVHLFERDCSIQRRHQKVVEEAPAPDLADGLRAALCATAVRAGQAIGYTGAGTVEFLLTPEGAFYFMEMNTRLQVEHPITEMVTGQDLVEWQLRVAAGERLPLLQEQITAVGHAIEVRLCAEDPARGFLPATGRLTAFRIPDDDLVAPQHVGVRAGDEITPHYDSLIAKVTACDVTRDAAIWRLRGLLDDVRVAGVATNLGLLRQIAAHPEFLTGALDTGWLERHQDALLADAGPGDEGFALAALWLLDHRQRVRTADAARSIEPASPWHRTDGWRLNDRGHQTVRLRAGTLERTIEAVAVGSGFELEIGGHRRTGRVWGMRPARRRIALDERTVPVSGELEGLRLMLRADDRSWSFDLVDPLSEAAQRDEGPGPFVAPMPGRVVRCPLAPGTTVEAQAPLLVLEAMKMEHTLRAPVAGRLTALHVAEGDRVEEGVVLLDFEPDPDGHA